MKIHTGEVVYEEDRIYYPKNIVVFQCVPIANRSERWNKPIFQFIKDNTILCVCCHRKGTHVITYRQIGEPPGTLHTDVFCQTPRNMVLMTVDHILPVSLGGFDRITNLRPMCARCNSKRGNDITYDEMIMIISNLNNHINIRSVHMMKKFNQFVSLVDLTPKTIEYNSNYTQKVNS